MTIYSEPINISDHVNAFQPVDALARLIVFMIKYNGDAIATKVHHRGISERGNRDILVMAHFGDGRYIDPQSRDKPAKRRNEIAGHH